MFSNEDIRFSDSAALALCEQAAQKYIRESGYATTSPGNGDSWKPGTLILRHRKDLHASPNSIFSSLNGSLDWPAAARLVAGQKEKTNG
jgi:hypothetical protein